MASRPEPISAIRPSHNHALARAFAVPPETDMLCEFTVTPRKSAKYTAMAGSKRGTLAAAPTPLPFRFP
jgi:hypothetical protein